MIKKIGSLMVTMMLAVSFTLVGCSSSSSSATDDPTTETTGIEFNSAEYRLSVGGSFRPVWHDIPNGGTWWNTDTWSSSNPAVATVSEDGEVTGCGNGTAKISVTITQGEKRFFAQCDVTVKAVTPEGSLSEPIPLTLNENREFMIANSMSSESYYSFRVTEAGLYALDLPTPESYTGYLYSDAAFSVPVIGDHGSAFSATSSLGFTMSLPAAGTYYLRIKGEAANDQIWENGMICDQAYMIAHSVSSCTKTNLGALTLGTKFTGQRGYRSFDKTSYFTFTTNDYSRDYAITNATEGTTPNITLYSDSAFSVGRDVKSGSRVVLESGTEYYVKLQFPDHNLSPSDVSVLVDSIPVPTMIDLAVGDSWTAGAFAVGDKEAWYRVPVSQGTSYSMYLDNYYDGSGTMTSRCNISAYHIDRMTPYFTGDISAYTTPRNVTIATGNPFLYILVSPSKTSSATTTYAIKVIKQ